MAKNSVSLSVIRRLPRYHRFLKELLATGTVRISSKDLARKMRLSASQIRQDLNCFGGFGQQGYGYNVEALYQEISHILGLDQQRTAILLGAGNLGKAISQHMDFSSRGFTLVGVFDNNPALIGQQVGELTILDSKEIDVFCKAHGPSVAILCIPKDAAIEVADKLIGLGIRGFWNFSHYDLLLDHQGIVVENVHLGDSLSTLCCRLNRLEED
ncbi:MAG: redox-sensing transcriptional repressor Rex [Oscillospiraceae bacterium]|jgi:redox-sensing transcriptional repressor|nr:redox-sensing transcriptional repressor Rex [Oscillospiraceae bacterium]